MMGCDAKMTFFDQFELLIANDFLHYIAITTVLLNDIDLRIFGGYLKSNKFKK
jgi:hypothetical protein